MTMMMIKTPNNNNNNNRMKKKVPMEPGRQKKNKLNPAGFSLK